MRKTILAVAIAIASLVAFPAAEAQTHGNFGYVDASAGSAEWNAAGARTNEFAFNVIGGYMWRIDSRNSLGPEIGYIDFGTPNSDLGFTSLNAKAVTVGANYRFNFTNSNFLQARAGYARSRFSMRTDLSPTFRKDTNGWYAGVGVGHNFSDALAVKVGYDYYRFSRISDVRTHIGVPSIGLEYQF